jgi:hypothetical protein
MDADLIQAVVARCLVDPEFLPAAPRRAPRLARGTRRTAKPSATREHQTAASDDFAALAASDLFAPDCLERLSLFRGFIVKVKHNSVRRALPLTFRLLLAVGKELAFFRYYAPSYLAVRSSGPLALERQVQLMAKHLPRFLEADTSLAGRAVADVLMHEMALWSLRANCVEIQPPQSAGAIAWRGEMEIRRYGTDVLHACAALAARDIEPARDLRDRDHALAYWRPSDCDAVEIFDIDDLTALLFSMVDGHRSLADIAAQLAGIGMDQMTAPELDEFFRDLAARGFVEAASSRFEQVAAASSGRNAPCA